MDNVKKIKAQLSKLKNDIDLMEKKRSMADAEQRATTVNNKSELKKNSLEMKQLRMEVEELQVRLKRQQLNDDKLVQEVSQEKNIKFEDFKGLQPKEIIQKLESCVLDLNCRSNSLSEKLNLLERTYNEDQNCFKDMIEKCKLDDFPSEEDCLKRARQIQNEHHKVLRNIEGAEDSKNKMKIIDGYLRKIEECHIRILMDLKKKLLHLEMDDDENEQQDKAEKKILSDADVRYAILLEQLGKLKDATCFDDLEDMDSLFLEQKRIYEFLKQLKIKSEKRLEELKAEKRGLASRSAMLKEANDVYPNIGEEISLSKNRLKEQKVRCDSSKKESEKLDIAVKQAKEYLQRYLSMFPEKLENWKQEDSLLKLAKTLEDFVRKFVFEAGKVYGAKKDKPKLKSKY